MIENALGYFNADPGYQYSRGGRDEVCLSSLTIGSAHIRGIPVIFSLPTTFPHNQSQITHWALCLS